MNSNITNFFQVRVQVRVQKFLFFEFEFGQNCRVLRVRSPGFNREKNSYRYTHAGHCFTKNFTTTIVVGNVVEWLERRDCDQYGLGSKPARAILLYCKERHFTAHSLA